MSQSGDRLRLFVDHNVAESAARVLESAGHALRRLRGVLPRDAPDDLVAATAIAAGEVLLTHDKDFKQLARRAGVTRRHFSKLDLIKLSCAEPDAAMRLAAFMSLIEHEWRYTRTHGMRMFLDIGASAIRVER